MSAARIATVAMLASSCGSSSKSPTKRAPSAVAPGEAREEYEDQEHDGKLQQIGPDDCLEAAQQHIRDRDGSHEYDGDRILDRGKGGEEATTDNKLRTSRHRSGEGA